jgi:hypothetical protein
VPVYAAAGSSACPGAVRETAGCCCGPAVGQIGAGQRPAGVWPCRAGPVRVNWVSGLPSVVFSQVRGHVVDGGMVRGVRWGPVGSRCDADAWRTCLGGPGSGFWASRGRFRREVAASSSTGSSGAPSPTSPTPAAGLIDAELARSQTGLRLVAKAAHAHITANRLDDALEDAAAVERHLASAYVTQQLHALAYLALMRTLQPSFAELAALWAAHGGADETRSGHLTARRLRRDVLHPGHRRRRCA